MSEEAILRRIDLTKTEHEWVSNNEISLTPKHYKLVTNAHDQQVMKSAQTATFTCYIIAWTLINLGQRYEREDHTKKDKT